METIFDNLKKQSLFEEKHSHRHWTVVQVLKKYCLGWNKRRSAKYIIEKANRLLAYGEIANGAELRQIIQELRKSETFLRIIGSRISGYWLPLTTDKEEQDPNQMLKNRLRTVIDTAVGNGVGVKYIYTIVNEAKKKHFPADKQLRGTFNSEKEIIARYSDDLLGQDIRHYGDESRNPLVFERTSIDRLNREMENDEKM